METKSFQPENTEQEEFSIVEIFFHYLRYWKWFLISAGVCLALAYAYLLYATPEYRVFSRIIINDEKKDQNQEVSSTAFSDIGLTPPKTNLDNEIEILRSRTIMKGVADSLRLEVSYFKKGKIKEYEIYKKTPVFVSVSKVMTPGSFTVDLTGENALLMRSDKDNINQKVEMGKDINSPWGILRFTPNQFGSESYPIEVVINSGILPFVDVASVSKTSSVVELSIVTPIPQKGQDIVNTLVAQYNKNAVDDQNYVANSTIKFIDARLDFVSGELQTAEQNVEDYQKAKGITDLQAQGQLLLTSSSDYNKQITDAQIQLSLLKQIQDFIMSPANKESVTPSNVGITDPTVISLIGKYNEAMLAKKTTTGGMLENHPLLIEYNNQLALIRDDLLKGIDISEKALQATIKELQRQNSMNMGMAQDMTTQQRETRDLTRQQGVKETIYTYLLQKREDQGLSLMMAKPLARVVDPAAFSFLPVLPKKMIILLAALILGIIIPIIVIYIKDLFDNKIHTKEDVTKIISAPFLGVISVIKSAADPFPVLKIRSSIAERFRTVISNLGFIVGNEKRKIIAVTSYSSGDGKSFFSRNLAISLATSGKKTLLIDLDLRKSVLVKLLGLTDRDKGSTMFLSDPNIKISEIIDNSHTYHKNLDIIPVHVFPPNPAELLSSERLEQLFQNIGGDYEYVIIDTAPIGLVADAYSINHYALATIFVLRSDYTLKKNLTEIQELYRDRKLNNLSVVLNAVTDENIYGYGYGHYGNYNNKHNYYADESE